MKKKIIFRSCTALVVAGLGVGLVATGCGKKEEEEKKYTTAKEHLQYVYEKGSSSALEAVSMSYTTSVKQMKEMTDISKMASFKVTLGEDIKSLAAMLVPQIEQIDDAGVRGEMSYSDDAFRLKLLTTLNSENLLSTMFYLDKEGKAYMSIPELSDAYLDCSEAVEEAKSSMKDMVSSMEDLSELATKEGLLEAMDTNVPELKTIQGLAETFSALFWEHIGDVSESETTLKAEGVEGKYTALSFDVTSEEMCNLVDALADELPKNQDMKDLLKKIDEENYEDMMKEIENADVDQLKKDLEKAKFQADVTLYVNGNEEIHGTEIKVKADNEEGELKILMPVDEEDQFGYLVSAASDGKELGNIKGKGTVKNGSLKGTFGFSLSEEVDLGELKDVSRENILKLDVNEYKVTDQTCSYDMVISTEAMEEIAGFGIKLAGETKDEKSSSSISLVMQDNEALTLTFEAGDCEKLEGGAPEKDSEVFNVNDEEEMEQYIEGIDLESYISDVLDKTGIEMDEEDVLDMIEDVIAS